MAIPTHPRRQGIRRQGPRDFHESGRLYVVYTGKEEVPGEIHVAELTSIGTLRNLLTIPHPEDSNHYGGQLQFGPEEDLYISTGDGGGADDKHHNAQDLESLLGKILRIDPLASGLQPYTIPDSNPFVGEAGKRGEIWSYGLRNPFRFSFDSVTGGMVIGDVGQASREEVDYAPSTSPGFVGGKGAHYGRNCREGFIVGPGDDLLPGECAAGSFTEPVFDYQPPPTCPAPVQSPQPATRAQPTFIGIKAQRRRVERGKTAVLTVWVSPCSGRKGETLRLLRNGHPNGTQFLSRACTARFLRRIRRGTTFAAATGEERGYLPGESRKLKIRLARHRRRH